MSELVLIGGMPAGGKTTATKRFADAGYERLNRDTVGGTLDQLLPRLEALLAAGKSVVMDNLYPTRDSRQGPLKVAAKAGVAARFVGMDTSLEDAQFNACLRMIDSCGRVLHPEDHKQPQYKDNPNLFPVAVIYKYRKDHQPAHKDEGFAAIETEKFVRRHPAQWTGKAVIFDFDGTLRTNTGEQKYPTKPSEVLAMKNRAPRIRQLTDEGYVLLGASNQSGIAKGTLTQADAEACFAETLKQLEVSLAEVRFCPHKVPPITCYCRKPGPGMGVELIARYKLDPKQCIYVGDMGTDRSFAGRCGFQFVDHQVFFRGL